MTQPRILLGAYACHPDRGSEPTVGWNRAVEASRLGDIDVITHVEGDNVEAIAAAIDRDGLDTLRFHFLAHTPFEEALMRLPGGYYPGYRRWQRRAYHLAERLHAQTPFDLVHQVNMCGYREPGDLWRLDAPFVWGPVGGTQNTPAGYLLHGGLKMAASEGLRSVLNWIQLRASPRVRAAARTARTVLTANSTGRRDLRVALGIESRQLLETGIRSISASRRWADRQPGPFRLLWAGEVRSRKGIRVMLDAMAQLRAVEDAGGPAVRLTIVGEGPEMARVRRTPGVDALGWIPRADLLALYHEVDALAFTSLRDTSGNVMLEALAAGLPVLYLDHQGAADVCDASCGISIPVSTPAESVAALAEAAHVLATDPDRYETLSRGAVARAEALHWATNGAAMASIYAEVLGRDLQPVSSSSHLVLT